MPNLKDLKLQINSVGSTKKITSAMKMVAASKLRRSQEKAEAARPYSSRLEEMLSSLASSAASGEGVIKLLTGTGNDENYVVCFNKKFKSKVKKNTRPRKKTKNNKTTPPL